MKQSTFNNYSWVDIIEPSIPVMSFSLWGYLAITLIAVLIFLIAEKNFNLYIKLRFLLISRKIKKSNQPKTQIKNLLQLLRLEKTALATTLLIKNIDKTTINKHREILLNACYSRDSIDLIKLNNTLQTVWKWL